MASSKGNLPERRSDDRRGFALFSVQRAPGQRNEPSFPLLIGLSGRAGRSDALERRELLVYPAALCGFEGRLEKGTMIGTSSLMSRLLPWSIRRQPSVDDGVLCIASASQSAIPITHLCDTKSYLIWRSLLGNLVSRSPRQSYPAREHLWSWQSRTALMTTRQPCAVRQMS